MDPVTNWSVRRYMYKETVPDPAGPTAPKSSIWSTLSSSLTAEAAAREALEESRVLEVPAGVTQTVKVVPLDSAVSGGQVAWMTQFIQSGSPRVLPMQAGTALPAGAVLNLHATSLLGEVVRTITFVEPESLEALDKLSATADEADAAAAEARTRLIRYGFLRPQEGVTISRVHPTEPGYSGPEQQKGAILWFETGPARLLPKPLFGSLPPDTTAYLLPGPNPDTVIRCFATAPHMQATLPAATGGGAPGSDTGLAMLVTGPGVVGAASVSFDGLEAGSSDLAPPMAVTESLFRGFRQTLMNASVRGTPNLTSVNPGAAPADWRFWSPYHGVFIRAAEYDALSDAQRTALRDWVIQGGLLYLEPTTPGPLIGGPLSRERLGAGTITLLPWTIEDYLAPPEINEAGTAYVKVAEPVELLDFLQFYAPALSLPSGEMLHPVRRSTAQTVDGSAENGRWAALLIAGFALLAGPVNLFWLAPAGKRHRLFFTLPFFAAAFAVVLGASILWWDGFGGTGDRSALVIVLPEENRTVVYQDQIADTGVLASRTFQVADDTLMANLSVDEYDATGRSSLLERGTGTAGGDWFRNHWGTAQHLRQLEDTHSGVEVVPGRGSSAPQVRSTIETTLHDFVYLDDFYRVWRAADVPPDTVVTLERSSGVKWPPLRPTGSKYLDAVFTLTVDEAPGRWIAHGGISNIAPIRTLDSVRWNDDLVYTGIASRRADGFGLALRESALNLLEPVDR